jgi:hypothetical protein
MPAIECPLNASQVPYLQHILNHAIFGIKVGLKKLKPIAIKAMENILHEYSTEDSQARALNACLSCVRATKRADGLTPLAV